MTHRATPTFSLLAPPYRELLTLDDREALPRDPRILRGAALVWSLAAGHHEGHLEVISKRPGGLPLMVMLPNSRQVSKVRSRVLEVLEEARPQAILPFHPTPDVRELKILLRSEPDDLAGEVIDYLWWRGLRPDQETRRILRRTVELSAELTTLSALARAVYLSRRALGRRFRKLGLPVPSHWLQFCRLLRAAIRLQNSGDSLFSVSSQLGYPDGFTLSSQMDRLVGVRPSVVRQRLGWEWFIEAWLWREWMTGGMEVRLEGFPDRTPPTDPTDPDGNPPHAASSATPTGLAEDGAEGDDPDKRIRAKRRDSAA